MLSNSSLRNAYIMYAISLLPSRYTVVPPFVVLNRGSTKCVLVSRYIFCASMLFQ